jgi:hypothetical protein
MNIRNEFRSCMMLPLCVLLALALALFIFVEHRRTIAYPRSQPHTVTALALAAAPISLTVSR